MLLLFPPLPLLSWAQEWLPDLGAHVEAQFDKKKAWYHGSVTRINADDSMSVRFTTNVTEANLPPEKVRLCPGKCPPSTKNYRASSPATTDLKVGDCVTAPFEKNTPPGHEGYPGKIVKLDALAGCCDVNFKFNNNVSFPHFVRYVTT